MGPTRPLLMCTVLLACGPGKPSVAPAPAENSAPPLPAAGPAPPAKPSWSSAVTRGVLAGEYRIRAEGNSFLAVNRAGGLRARWSAGGGLSAWRSRMDDKSARRSEIGLKAVAVGRGDAARALRGRDLALGACRSDGVKDEHGACLRRLEQNLGGLTEWWENRGDGIAHGFVVDRPPTGPAGAASWLRVKVRVTGARIELLPDGEGAMLASRDQRFAYRGLFAWDADRKSLPTRMRRSDKHLLLEVDDRGARYPVIIDPVLTAQGWGYESNQATVAPDQPAGQDMVVAGAGDVNGDTHQDVLVGFPRYNSAAGANSGIVYLFLGSPTGPSTTPAWSSEGTNAANTAAAPTPNALFGRSIAAGRINGDAFSDVVIGQVAWGNGEALEGRVYVFFGQAGTSPLPAVANQVLEGRSMNAFFGRAVALGNLDGVNGADLIVGSSGFSANAGRVELYLANTAGAFPADTAASDTVVGAAGSSLGESVAVGDTNADGRADVHAAARTYSVSQSNSGAIYSLVTDAGGLVGTPFVFYEVGNETFLGKVAFAGDVNGDGFGDVVGGAGGRGGAFVLYGGAGGVSATGLVRIVDARADGTFAIGAVAGPVDVDNDGFFDVVLGAPSFSNPGGAVLVIRGSATGLVASVVENVDQDSRFFGEESADGLGATVAVAGDVNKDGFGDLLVGAPGFENGAEIDEGKAYLLLGGVSSAKQRGQACTTNGQCHSGFCVDGNCCETICGGTPGIEADNTGDCQACSIAAGGSMNGVCGLRPIATACASANLCLMSSVCDETGACIGGVPRTCAGSTDSCRAPGGVCDPATGVCSNPPVTDGTACDDANACTATTTCQAGICTGTTTVTCPAPALCKLPGTCNPATGACDYANIPDGTACTDGNMCTSGEVCLAGACVTTPALTCGAESACKNAGSCDPATGVCAQTSKADGLACDDGNMCTLATTCAAGACAAGTARSCDDANPCTTDSCAPATGCVNTLMTGCVTDAGSTDATDATDASDAADGPDAPGDAGDGPRDGAESAEAPSAETATEVRPPDTVTDGATTDGSTDRTTDVLATDAAATDAATTDGAARDATTPLKARGSGCDCGVGGPGPGGTLPPALLIALGLAVTLVRRRRRR